MNIPCREKTIDEAIGIYVQIKAGIPENIHTSFVSVVGCHKTGDYDLFVSTLPDDKAKAVVKAHDEFRHKLYEILCY